MIFSSLETLLYWASVSGWQPFQPVLQPYFID